MSTSCFEACHNQMLLFWGTRPAVCLLPCLILIQGDNPPGPTCLICEQLTLHEIWKQSLCPWIAGIFMAESRGLEHNAHFRSSAECGCVAQSTDCWGLSWGYCSSNSVTKGGLVLCIVGVFGYNLVPSESLGFVTSEFSHWQLLSKSSGCSLRIQNAGQEFRVGKNSAQV